NLARRLSLCSAPTILPVGYYGGAFLFFLTWAGASSLGRGPLGRGWVFWLPCGVAGCVIESWRGEARFVSWGARLASRLVRFERALSVAKAVRSETGISDHAVSVSYAAVELAKKIFESLQQRTVIVLGAGDTAELAVRYLVQHGVATVFIANRTSERAERLAQ